MMEGIFSTLLTLKVGYLVLGLIFSLYFLTKGIFKLDSSAQGSSWLTRLLFLPGTIFLWPYLLYRLLKAENFGSAN